MLTILPLKIELGVACGKLFRCSTMAILDAGDSDILPNPRPEQPILRGYHKPLCVNRDFITERQSKHRDIV